MLAVLVGPACAQENPRAVKALLVSDVHFEPFWDPGKAAQLAAAPARNWQGILESAPLPDRAARFAALMQSCHMRGADTSYPLLASALAAMKMQAAGTRFVTVSGDLIAHEFDCKYGALFPRAKPGDYRAFVEKTIEFVVAELKQATPDVPVYVALGNNDSECGDYQMDPDGRFLADVGALIAGSVPQGDRAEAMETLRTGGYYSAMLPAPVENTRLVVLNDVLLSPRYASCGGTVDPAPGNAELTWLGRQLADARAAHQQVWVMGHIPPGVNAHSTLARSFRRCSAKPPIMFLVTDKLGQELADAGDEVRLAIFGHVHTDEIELLQPDHADAANAEAGAGEEPSQDGRAIAVKIVPSITPINGNSPAFIVAQVNPSTAQLIDYEVFAAADKTGTWEWRELYDFDRTYGVDSYSPDSVRRVLAEFAADRGGTSAASRSYMRNFLTGSPDVLLPLVWPQYVCTLSHATAAGFTGCACAATAGVLPGR